MHLEWADKPFFLCSITVFNGTMSSIQILYKRIKIEWSQYKWFEGAVILLAYACTVMCHWCCQRCCCCTIRNLILVSFYLKSIHNQSILIDFDGSFLCRDLFLHLFDFCRTAAIFLLSRLSLKKGVNKRYSSD